MPIEMIEGLTCREHVLPVKKLLSSGRNTISITIHPAPQEARTRAEAYPYEVPTMEVSCMPATAGPHGRGASPSA